MAKIINVQKGSLAEELGLEKGDSLIGFNGEKVVDILDVYFYEAQCDFVMNLLTKQGETVDLHIEKNECESFGFELDDSLDLEPIRCKNKCVFCFIDQMPKGMRESLYVKDDDYRLSFASGNYVTLTNCGQAELQRIAKLKLSPLYISVHAYDKDVKVKLVGNPESAKLFEKMHFLADNGIDMHAQIVLCKGLNDSRILQQTLEELHGMGKRILSVAIVPLGVTKCRQTLAELKQVDAECASETIDIVSSFDKSMGGGWCFAADEFYLLAGRTLPNYESYGSFGQIEDGIGLCADFIHSFKESLNEAKPSKKKGELTFVTGVAFYPTLRNLLSTAQEKFPNFIPNVVAIQNNFFGKTITVAGLVTAGDIIAQLKTTRSNLVIPSTMLRQFSDTFLDGMTVAELQKQLKTKVYISKGGADTIRLIREETK